MKRNSKLVLAGVAAATLGIATAGAVAYGDWGHGRGGWRHHHGGSMGFMGLGGFGGPFGKLCRGDSAEMADHLLVRIEHKVKPTEAQQAAFDELKTATRAAAEKIASGCPERPKRDASDDTPRPRLTPIDRLDRAETQLEATLEALKTVRPAAEKFYAALSDEQKQKLSERRWRGHWKRGERRRGGPDGAPAETEPAPSTQQ